MKPIDTQIIVAIIAAIISFIGLIITKEQKISEFRQKWIDNIRDDISDLMGCLSEFLESWSIVPKDVDKGKNGKQFIKDNMTTIRKIETFRHRITLRLNPKKDKMLISTLKSIDSIITKPDVMSKDNVLENEKNKLNNQSHELLKKEWERVKKGEMIFRISKYVFGLLVLLAIYYLYKQYVKL